MRVVLIEVGGSHDECLYAQAMFLKSRPEVHLTMVCNEQFREHMRYFGMVDEFHFVNIRSGFKERSDLRKVNRFIKDRRFDKVIFNTAQGSRAKKLLSLSLAKQTELIGILHNINKLQSRSSRKKVLGKFNKLFVLSEALLITAKQQQLDEVAMSSFYPMFFPDYPIQEQKKNEGEIWVCIPGQVELKRRDYEGLFTSIEQHGIPGNVKFLLLGRCAHKHGDGAYIKERIKKLGVADNFMLWDSHIGPEEYFSMMKYSDLVLPLIHPGHPSFQLYSTQITGAFNLAFGLQKPLLMEEGFRQHTDLGECSIFYGPNDLMQTIDQLTKIDGPAFYREEHWSFDHQNKRYWDLLDLPSK